MCACQFIIARAGVNDSVGYGPTHLSSLERGIDIGVQMQMQI